MNSVEHLSYQPFDQDAYMADLQQYIVTEYLSTTGELNWARLICTWNEKKTDGTIHTHTYAPCVDAITGEVYVDDRPGLIFAKIFAHMFARPIFTIIKTSYHLTFYPTFKEIGKALSEDKNGINKIKNIFKTIADIVLTPLCGLILTISSAVILILGLFNNETLYEGRKLLGRVECFFNWGQTKTEQTMAKCFQADPIEIFTHYGYADFEDTIYDDRLSVDHALTNFARANIHYKIKNCDFFACGSHGKNEIYQSYLPYFS